MTTLLDLSEAMTSSNKVKTQYPIIEESDIELFKDILAIDGAIVEDFYKTNNSAVFFKAYPSIKKLLGKKATEAFYAYKIGRFYEGIPSRLVFILIEGFNKFKEVNVALNAMSNLLLKYAGTIFETPTGDVELQDVIDNVLGRHANIILKHTLKVDYDNYSEVFIMDTNMVALLPKDISGMLSYDDIVNITYNSNVGLVLNDIPLRITSNCLGLTLHDYDLREVL